MLIVGERPQWLRILLVPSQEFVQSFSLLPDGDLDPSNDPIITDPVTLRFDAGFDSTQNAIESSFESFPAPDGSVRFAIPAERVNQLINDCGALSRRVRLTIGNHTWATGRFEIDGEW